MCHKSRDAGNLVWVATTKSAQAGGLASITLIKFPLELRAEQKILKPPKGQFGHSSFPQPMKPGHLPMHAKSNAIVIHTPTNVDVRAQ